MTPMLTGTRKQILGLGEINNKVMSNCSRRRVKSPNGTWGYNSLIGGQVRVRSTAVTNFFGSIVVASETFTIKDIYFQISLDGKAITIIELAEVPGKFFTWKDLEVVEVGADQKVNATCGTFTSNETLAGYNVDHEPSWLDQIKNGIAIIDKEGNIIVNRYIRLTNAEVNEVRCGESGEYNISEVTFCGDLII